MKIKFDWILWILIMMFLMLLLIGVMPRKRSKEEESWMRAQIENELQLQEERQQAQREASDLFSILKREREKCEAVAEATAHNAMWDGSISCDEFVAKVEGFTPKDESGEALTTKAGYNVFFRSYAKEFYYIPIQHGLNPMYVFTLGLLESYYGSSQIAVNNCNLFGLGAYEWETTHVFSYPSVEAGIRDLCNLLEEYSTPGSWQYQEIEKEGECPTSINGQSLLFFNNPKKGEQLLELMNQIFS